MQIRQLKEWNGITAGTVWDATPHDVGRQLIERGIAEEIKQVEPQADTEQMENKVKAKKQKVTD